MASTSLQSSNVSQDVLQDEPVIYCNVDSDSDSDNDGDSEDNFCLKYCHFDGTDNYTEDEKNHIKSVNKMPYIQYTTRQPNKALVYLYTHPKHVHDLESGYGRISEKIKLLNQNMTQFDDLRRGDIVIMTNIAGYRNDGLFIFDGTEVIHLAWEPDDYGTIPIQFKVPEDFPITYWEDIILHNAYVPFDFVKWSDQLQANFTSIEFETPKKRTSYTSGKFQAKLYHSFFTYKDEKYYVICNNLDEQNTNVSGSYVTKSEFMSQLKDRKYLSYIFDDDDEYLLTTLCRVLDSDKDHLLTFSMNEYILTNFQTMFE